MYPYRNFDAIIYQKHYQNLAPNLLRELLLTPKSYQDALQLKTVFETVVAYAKEGNKACQDFLLHECQFIDSAEGLLTDKIALAEQAFQQHQSPAVALVLFSVKLKNKQLDEAVKCLTVALTSDNRDVQLDLLYMFQGYNLALFGRDEKFKYIMEHCEAFKSRLVSSGILQMSPEAKKQIIWEKMQGFFYERIMAGQSDQSDAFIAWLKQRGFLEKNSEGDKAIFFENALNTFLYSVKKGKDELAWQSFVEALICNKHGLDCNLLSIFTGFMWAGPEFRWFKLLNKLLDFKNKSPQFINYIAQNPLIASAVDKASLFIEAVNAIELLHNEKRREVIARLVEEGVLACEEDYFGSDSEDMAVDEAFFPALATNNLVLLYAFFPEMKTPLTQEALLANTLEEMLLTEKYNTSMGQAFRQCMLDPNNNYAAAIKFNLMFTLSDTDRETLKNYFVTAMVNKEPDIVAYFIIMIASCVSCKRIDYLNKFKELCSESQQFLMDYAKYYPGIRFLCPDLIDAVVPEPQPEEPVCTKSLTQAVSTDNLADVQYHLQQGANPHERMVARNMDNNHFYLKTPLHRAVKQGNVEIVKELLVYIAKYRLPARVYFRDKTPLDLAIARNHQDIIAILQAFEASARLDFFALFANRPSHRPFWQHDVDKQQNTLRVLLQSLAEGKHEQVQYLLKKHPMMLCLRPNPNSLAGHLFCRSAFEYAWLVYDNNVLGRMLACLPDTDEGLQIKDILREQMMAINDPLTADKQLLALCDSKKAMVEGLLVSHSSASSSSSFRPL